MAFGPVGPNMVLVPGFTMLFPASTQIAVFVSMDVGTFFALDSVQIKVDDKEVANYLYTARELEALPERIAALEAEQAALNARLADPVVYRGAPEELRTLNERLAALDREIAQAMLRWEELEARSEGAS